MNKLNTEQRAVREHLREAYGIDDEIRFFGGGNHPRVQFNYNGKRCVLTLHRQPGGRELGASTIEMKIRDITRLLGEPPNITAERPKRTLEDMTMKLQAKAPAVSALERSALVPLLPAVPAPAPVSGSMALYRSGSNGSPRLRFTVSEILAARFSAGVTVIRTSPDSWHLSPSNRKKPALRRKGGFYQLDCEDVSVVANLPFFGSTPAKYTVNPSGGLDVRVDLTELRPLKIVPWTKRDGEHLAQVTKKAPIVKPTAADRASIDTATDILSARPEAEEDARQAAAKRIVHGDPLDPRVLLRAVTETERTTGMRLTRMKDGWVWIIRLEDET